MTRDRPWCPDCREPKWSWERTDSGDRCDECAAAVVDEWPLWGRVRQRLAQGIAAAILGAVVFGPPAWAIWRALSGAPWFATRTVTKTVPEPYGIIPEVAPVILLWALVLFISWAMASGRLPRPPM